MTSTTSQSSTPQVGRRHIGWALYILAGCIVLILGLLLASRPLARFAERRLAAELQHAYNGRLHVQNSHISVFPGVSAELEGITISQDDSGGLPLISIKQASASTGYLDILRRHIRSVSLQQLEVHVPPRRENLAESKSKDESPHFTIDNLVANGTKLEILPKSANKHPLQFEIRDLTLTGNGPGGSMNFHATLTNPEPPGLIRSSGTFGPWKFDDPALTPVHGSYQFQNADLSVFKGISGTLSSEGTYQGVLDRISVEGHADVPDFTVLVSGNPVHLMTKFQAVVDGMNGDTVLDPVNGQFGHTSLVARGVVHGNLGEPGRSVDLDVQIDQGRLEDVLTLGAKGKPLIAGVVSLHAKLGIPPGPVEIPNKLNLKGQFQAMQARFEKLNIQERVDKLSARGRGDTDDADDPDVASNFRGQFTLKDGVMSFDQVSFEVPGVQVALQGTYGLLDEAIDIHGTASLTAKLSQTVSGFKSFLLKPLDPFFHKNGVGTQIPIHIGGTRSKPSFGLDLKNRKQADGK